MKTLALATALFGALLASSANAGEIGNTGISLGGTLDTNYTTGENVFAVDFIPRAQFSNWGILFGAQTTLDVMGLNDGDIFKGIDLDASYDIGTTGLKAYGKIGTDSDFVFGNAKIGVSFAF